MLLLGTEGEFGSGVRREVVRSNSEEEKLVAGLDDGLVGYVCRFWSGIPKSKMSFAVFWSKLLNERFVSVLSDAAPEAVSRLPENSVPSLLILRLSVSLLVL